MQACFIAIATKSCDGCTEMTKSLNSLSVHLERMHVLDVCKPSKASRSTVKTSSFRSNLYCYQSKSWMTGGTELRWLLCLGRSSCKKMEDLGKLMLRRLLIWTQFNLDYLKGGIMSAQNGSREECLCSLVELPGSVGELKKILVV